MANTTNFNWATPDDTDLVKDGALAIRTLGSAIDASLVDLKGGSTGQILAKTSSTDLDFEWITNDNGDITAVNTNSPLTGGATSGSVTLSYDYAAGSKVTLNAQTATYTVVLADADQKLVTMSVASANDFLIPTNANVAFAVGTVINVIQIGAGQTTIKAVTSGTTSVFSTGAAAAAPKLRAQYSAASLIKVATDSWYVVGDII
jgi:NADPH-dependent glutamate synthase beta subunit-like oxidoreductase